MVRLEDLIGNQIVIMPKVQFRPDALQRSIYIATLRGYESGGVWIENDALLEVFMTAVRQFTSMTELDQSPVFFLPYTEIQMLVTLSTPLNPEDFE